MEERRDLGRRARTVGVVLWSSFLAACAGTMFFFAFIAPADIIGPAEGGGWQDHLGIYSLGFFGLWCLGAVASAIALYLRGLEHRPESRS
jgi:O-antigen/teichoic acid export membrane protein